MVLSYFIDSMKIKQTVIISAIFLGVISFSTLPSTIAGAAERCAGVDTSIIKCNPPCATDDGRFVEKVDNNCPGGSREDVNSSGVIGILKLIITIMTTGVGILAVGGIVYGSILYTSAGGSSEQTKKAIGIITNVVIGLIVYALMYAITNFLIPGGLFS